MIGKTLGHYEILEPLGAGGMGEVYRARDTTLKRDVAVKVLPPEFVDDPDRLARLEREAHLLASLNHPNIATIHSLEHRGDTRFLVLELVKGESLERRLVRGPLTIEKSIDFGKQIAEALEAAHGEGIIHRDLKPANVVITPDGRAKVLDFGIAKTVAATATDVGTEATNLTVAGTLVGTVPFMSPEQIRGEAVDKRADVWAFGCLLFEMLTGRNPFGRETVADTLSAIIEQQPDWERLPDATPDSVRSLLNRCLQKDAKLRLRDMGDAWVEMNALTTDPSGSITGSISIPGTIPAGASLPERRSAAPWIAAALVGGAAVGVLGMWFSMGSLAGTVPPPVRRAEIALLADQRIWGVPALSPDGLDLVYVAAAFGSGRLLYHRPMSDPAATALEGTNRAYDPFFSPDGEWVGFRADGDIKKMELSGGPVQTVCGGCVGGWGGATWLPNQSIVFASSGELYSVSSDRGTPTPFGPGGADRSVSYSRPSALPGGEGILVQLDPADGGNDDEPAVAIVLSDIGEPRILAQSGANPVYSPTGHVVFSREGSLFAFPFDLQLLQETGLAELVLADVGPRFSLSSDGTLVYPPGGGVDIPGVNEVMLVDLEGNATSLLGGPNEYMDVRRSPDGQRLALSVDVAGQDGRQIWVYDVDDGGMEPITLEGRNWFPVWSPDGARVAFRSGPSMEWTAVDDPSRARQQLTTAPGKYPRPGSFSPDGKTLAFEARNPDSLLPENQDIMLLPTEGDRIPKPFISSPADEITPRFSPDGRWLTYTSGATGHGQVYVSSYPEPSNNRVSRGDDFAGHAVWAPDGRAIYYRSGQSGQKMMRVTFEAGTGTQPILGDPELLFEAPGAHYDFWDDRAQYDIAPGGEGFVMLTWPADDPELGAVADRFIVVFNWFEELKQRVPAGR